MTLDDAIKLAHYDRDGHPLNPLKDPPPTPAEAVEILDWSLRNCGFNWLTGAEARGVCRAAAEAAAKAAAPLTYSQFIANVRRESRLLGVKLKMETFSWGPHCTWLVAGPAGTEPHRIGNVAPVWWTAEHVALLETLNTKRAEWHLDFLRRFPGEKPPVALRAN